MNRFVALLRAVNVGGTGKLPMADLVRLCQDCGFAGVSTFIASGNALFATALDEAETVARLERALLAYAGKPVGVLLRDAGEMAAIAAGHPFADAAASGTVTIFLPAPPPPDWRDQVSGLAGERLAAGRREIHVDYAGAMSWSKLKIPAARLGTARNLNTIRKLAALLAIG